MRRAIGALTLVAVLAGCATIRWQGGDRDQFQYNHQDCVKKANDQAPYIPIIVWIFGGWKIRETLYKDCMEKRGYQREGTR